MEKKPITLPLIPLRNMVGFPRTIFPFLVGRNKSILALKAVKNGSLIFLSSQKDGALEEPGIKDIEPFGIVGKVLKKKNEFDNTVKVLIHSLEKARILKLIAKEPYFLVKVEYVPFKGKITKKVIATAKEIVETFEHLLHLSMGNSPADEEMLERIRIESNPVQIAMNVAFQLPIPYKTKQRLLNIDKVGEFLDQLLSVINNEYEIAVLQTKIRDDVKHKIDDAQKRILLNQQIESIKKELNEIDGGGGEIDELKDKILDAGMPKETEEKALKELGKLDYTPSYSPEYTVILNYLDWMTSIPWKKHTDDSHDIIKAKAILEEDHWGLDKIKERILEVLAVRQLSDVKKGPVLCFVGPPGVGKTSLGKSIARAMDRKFVRISLGGVRDEAEIRGHRRTYIGALPGKILQTMKRADVVNPVFLMDEIDKLASDFRGDPASALLEVLDPEQNFMFNDHYLDVDYDLSKVFFITTANNIYSVPEPLRDRMEVIFLSGYTSLEKYHIAKNYLIPRQVKENGLKPEQIKFYKSGTMKIIESYTLESGVRNLERQIGKICRKVATKIVENGGPLPEAALIKKDSVREYLGVKEYHSSKLDKNNRIGVVNGLAWTRYGGVHLSIESVMTPGTGKIAITGQIGKVMKESAQIALSLIKANHKKLGIDPSKFKKFDMHLHIPEGAIPKDGPSAGITIATSMLSTYINKPVRWNCAMTGELTLKNKVLPIGGLKEKLLAALRIGIKHVIIPQENMVTLSDIPAEIKDRLEITPVSNIADIWEHLFQITL